MPRLQRKDAQERGYVRTSGVCIYLFHLRDVSLSEPGHRKRWFSCSSFDQGHRAGAGNRINDEKSGNKKHKEFDQRSGKAVSGFGSGSFAEWG